jgi:hypothetical protein
MRNLLIGAAAFLAVAMPGAASALTAASVGASYGNYDPSGSSDDADMYGIDGAFSHDFDNGWKLQLDGAHDRIDFDGADVGASYGAVNLGMSNDSHSVYGFVTMADLLASSGIGVGVGGQMHFAQASVNGSVAYLDIGEALLDSGSLTNVHLDGTWFATDNLGVYGEVGWTEGEFDGSDETDWTTLGIGVNYRFDNSPWTVYAGYQNREFDEGDIDSFRVGFSYAIGTGTSREEMQSGPGWNGAESVYQEIRAVAALLD